MPRPLRLEHPGTLWHVHNRGVERRDIYLDDLDRRTFLDLLSATVVTYHWRVHTFTLMTNHFHLIVETPEPTLSRGVQFLTGEYADEFNRVHRRVGHLFQGRFRSHLVEKESYLLELSRYIVLNPVRAGMVGRPGDWEWSSYRALAGLANAPSWLETATILDAFDAWDRTMASGLYRKFVAEGVGLTRSPWEDLIAGVYLGSAAFIARIEELARGRSWTPEHNRAQKTLTPVTVEQVRIAIESTLDSAIELRTRGSAPARLTFAVLARRRAVARFSEIAAQLGISVSGARAMYKRAAATAATDQSFRDGLEEVSMRISQCKVRV